jgi:E3 ubiquitin-protein ligase SIAH1
MSTITFLDEMRCSPEIIDQPKDEGVIDVMEHVNDHMPHSPKPNVAVSSSVRDLLECPVCLNAMYPPIHQVSFLNDMNSRINKI